MIKSNKKKRYPSGMASLLRSTKGKSLGQLFCKPIRISAVDWGVRAFPENKLMNKFQHHWRKNENELKASDKMHEHEKMSKYAAIYSNYICILHPMPLNAL